MADGARSDYPAVAEQLARIGALSPGRDVLGLARITALLERLGNPQRAMPPAFHVAGTNGKGSTCAFLRAMLEAQGYRVHAYTSPHLVRFNERIRLAGTLIDDEALATVLARVLDVAEGLEPSFFEVTTAAAFLSFAEVPADACIIEVGLGGRLDATNVLDRPLACGIASLGIDHEAFLLAPDDAPVPSEPLARIAFEKASIAKPGVPLVCQDYNGNVNATVANVARAAGAPLLARSVQWNATQDGAALHYRDAWGTLSLPLPRMAGAHQADNAALAVALVRAQTVVPVDAPAIAHGITAAHWPARMQQLAEGPLVALLPKGSALWLDGGHNPDAATRLAQHFAGNPPVHVIMGLLANKDAHGVITKLVPFCRSFVAIPVPDHDSHAPDALAALARDAGVADVATARDVTDALRDIAARVDGAPATVAILGSLYLAGDVLRQNEQLPD